MGKDLYRRVNESKEVTGKQHYDCYGCGEERAISFHIIHDPRAEADVRLAQKVRNLVAVLPNGWQDIDGLIPDSDSFAAALTSAVYTALKGEKEGENE